MLDLNAAILQSLLLVLYSGVYKNVHMNKMLSFSFFLPLFICVSNWFSLLPSFVHVARHINWLDSLNFDNTNFHLFYKPIQIIFTVFISNDSQSFFIVSLFNCILKKSFKKR